MRCGAGNRDERGSGWEYGGDRGVACAVNMRRSSVFGARVGTPVRPCGAARVMPVRSSDIPAPGVEIAEESA